MEANVASIEQAQLLYSRARYAEAGSVCERILKQGGTPRADVLLLMGACCYAKGEWHECVKNNRDALAIDHNLAEAYCNMGNALCELDGAEEAVDLYRMAAALKPTLVEAHNNLGNACTKLGRRSEAIEAYRNAVSLNPQLPDTLCNLGRLLKQSGDGEAALRCFNQVEYRDPACVLLGHILPTRFMKHALSVASTPASHSRYRHIATLAHHRRARTCASRIYQRIA